MAPLTSRIHSPTPTDSAYADLEIFSSSLATLFPDDVQNSHGVPGSHVIYQSPRFGGVKLHIPAHPDVEEGRKLFAHYLWNAGVTMAEGIESAGQSPWNAAYWDVRGKSVLELGAGERVSGHDSTF